MYIRQLNPDTTTKDMEDYLKENGITGRISCRMVSNTDTSRAFKIGISLKELDKVYEESFWPANIICRPFRAPWRYRGRM